jgi:hypothetical protein
MTIHAVLSIDDSSTIREDTTFAVRPEVGESLQFWHNGRESRIARITERVHFHTEDGFVLLVEAETVPAI